MNKTTTRFLLLSIFLLTYFSSGAQNIGIIGFDPPGLVCPGGTARINATVTETLPYTYEYWDGESWICCFGGNQTPYNLSIPATGQWIEVQRKYTNGVAVYKRESVGSFYTPIPPQIEAVPFPGTCNTSTGRIVVTDRSRNFDKMPRRFKLYDQNNVLRGNFLVDTSIYNFVNLPAGTYRVIVETPCNSVYSEKTDIIVTTSSQNPVLEIALNGHDDCLENNVNASVVLPESIPTAGVQYRMDGGTWQASNTFSNVTPWLSHQFSARLSGCFEANTTQFVSELSIPRIQSLERAKDTDCTPANNEIRVFVPEGSDAQIQFNHSGGWYNPGQWVGPLPDGTLHIRARSAYLPSCYRDTSIILSEHGSVSLIGADASNLTDCTLGNIGLQLRTEPAVSTGLEYFVEGKGWQSSAQFSGLSNGDKRIAIRSTGLCQVGLAADTVTLSEIIAPQIESIAPQGHDDCVVGNAGFSVYLVQSVSGVKFRINGGAWQEGNLFQNRPAGNYFVEAARADGTCVSSQNYALVETGSVSITGLSKANENDCVVGNARFQVLHTGGNQQGLKFRLNGGAWQDSAIFRNLTRMAVNVEAQIQKPSCTSSIVAWPDSIREQSNFPEIASVTITGDKNCTSGAQVAFTLKVPMTATYWLSPVKNNTTGVFPGLTSGTYTFQVYKTSNGCVQTRVVTIDEKLNFTLDSLRVQGGDDCLNNNAVVTIYHPYGNNSGLQFRELSRNTPWQTSTTFPLSTHGVGQYNLEARNVNGCTVWSGSIYGQERLNPEITGVLGIDGLSDCSLGNVTAQVQLLNSSAGSSKQYRLNGGAWNLNLVLPGFRHGLNRVEMSWYYSDGWSLKQCTTSKDIVIDEKAKEITGVLLDAATLNDCNLNNVKATIQVDGGTSNLRYVVTGKTEGTSNIFTNLNNGQYKAIIRDVVSTCRDTFNFSVAEPPALALPTPSVQNVVCFGAATGSISISPTGGIAPYTYLWSTGGTSASVTNLAAGTYSVTVSDSRGCSLSQMVQVTGPTQNNLPQISFTGSTSICKGESFSVSASGGGSYAWNTGATSSTISGSPENTTTYTLTVTNGLGCSASANRVITVNALPVPNIEGINTICAGQSTSLTATGGSSYAWQHGANTAVITVSPASTTTYKVTVSDAAGCSASYNRTVRVNALPSVQIGGLPNGPLCGTGSVVLTAISTTATSYRWSTNETSATISAVINAAAGFGVTVKDINGCEASAGGTVSVTPRPIAQILGGDIPCRGNSTVLTAIGGASYLWSNNATTSSISISKPTQNQTYSVTVSNGPGCNSVDYKTVVVPVAFTLGYSLEKDQDCTPNNTQIVPVPYNAQGAVTYLLTPLNTFDFSTSLSDLGAGQYTLSAIDGRGCMADTMVVINEAPAFHVQANISGDTLDCLRSNVQVSLSSTGGRGSVSYHFDSPQSAILAPSSFSSSTLRRRVYAVDTAGCVDSVEVLVRDSIVSDLISDYTLAFDRDCIDGNAAITIQLSSAGATLPLSFQLNRETPTAQFHFDSLRAGYYLIRARYQDCRDSVAVLVDERIPRITGFQYLNQGDCKPNNTGVKLQAISGWGTLRYQLDTRAPQDSSRFDSLAAGSHRFLVIDSLQCRDSLWIPINSEQSAYISVEDLVKCDSASGRISFRPNTQGVAAQYSIDGGKHWQTEVVFDSLPPGIYQPLRRKPSTGCIDSLNTVVLGRHCDTIPEAYFLQDLIRITEPNTSVLIRWEAKAPKWYRDTFYVKMKLEGDGFPHFNDGSRTNARTPELRGGDPLAGPNVYRYIGGGTHRDSLYLPMQDSAHLYTYPADYYFTLSTPEGGKTLVDPNRDITRVTVSLLGPDGTPESGDVKILCKEGECIGIGNENVDKANCYYWPGFPEPGKKVQTICQPGQYTRMALDENLTVIEKTVYTVKLSDLSVKIKAQLAVPFSCNNPDDSELEAVVTTNTSDKPITFKWSTGETTQRIKLHFSTSTYKVTVTQGDCSATAEYTLPNTCNAQQIKEFFEGNGFFAIPITDVQKDPTLRTPEQRTACPQPAASANNVLDYAKSTFKVNNGQVNPLSQLDAALDKFKTVFKYGTVSGLITSNDEVCACPNYLSDKKSEFSTGSGLKFWYHIFKQDPSCPETSCDMLFIKAKMPDGKTYPAGAADVSFLYAGYGFMSEVQGENGSNLLNIVDDLHLNNFASAKTVDMFEHRDPVKPEEIAHLLNGTCWNGFNAKSVAVLTPSAELVLLPESSVWRFRTPNKNKFAEGALTGFTKMEFHQEYITVFEPTPIGEISSCPSHVPGHWKKRGSVRSKWTEVWESRTDPTETNLLGYFKLGVPGNAYPFSIPTDPEQKSKLYKGNFGEVHLSDGCNQDYLIQSANIPVELQNRFTSSPSGLITDDLGVWGTLTYQAEKLYSVCPADIQALAKAINYYSPNGSAYVYLRGYGEGLYPGLFYEFFDAEHGGKSWAFVTPGTSNLEDPQIYVWNCTLATWQKISDKGKYCTVKSALENVEKLWPIFVQREQIHSALTLAGFTPLFGSLASIANGIIYVREKQTEQGVVEIVGGVVGLAFDVAGARELIIAGRLGGAGQLVHSCFSYELVEQVAGEVSCTSWRYTVVLDELLGENALLKLNELLADVADPVVLNNLNKNLKALVNNVDGHKALKWINELASGDAAAAAIAANIIKRALGELDFTVDEFIRLTTKLQSNSKFFGHITSNIDDIAVWRVFNRFNSDLGEIPEALVALRNNLIENPKLISVFEDDAPLFKVWSDIFAGSGRSYSTSSGYFLKVARELQGLRLDPNPLNANKNISKIIKNLENAKANDLADLILQGNYNNVPGYNKVVGPLTNAEYIPTTKQTLEKAVEFTAKGYQSNQMVFEDNPAEYDIDFGILNPAGEPKYDIGYQLKAAKDINAGFNWLKKGAGQLRNAPAKVKIYEVQLFSGDIESLEQLDGFDDAINQIKNSGVVPQVKDASGRPPKQY